MFDACTVLNELGWRSRVLEPDISRTLDRRPYGSSIDFRQVRTRMLFPLILYETFLLDEMSLILCGALLSFKALKSNDTILISLCFAKVLVYSIVLT